MRTAEEMYNYIKEHNLGTGFSDSWNKKHLKLVEDQLNPNERVLMCFIGLHNYRPGGKHNQNFAYAITDSRFIMCQKKLVGENVLIVLRKHLNDVTKTTSLLWGVIEFDTIKETFSIGVNKETTNEIYEKINDLLFNEAFNDSNESDSSNLDSHVERLKALKELLDFGAISQEEYDTKKEEILRKI